MTVDRLKRDLLNKLINARIDLAAYLQLRKAKGICQSAKANICVITCLNFAISCVKKHRP
jgi:biofilm regulator BssR